MSNSEPKDFVIAGAIRVSVYMVRGSGERRIMIEKTNRGFETDCYPAASFDLAELPALCDAVRDLHERLVKPAPEPAAQQATRASASPTVASSAATAPSTKPQPRKVGDGQRPGTSRSETHKANAAASRINDAAKTAGSSNATAVKRQRTR